MLKQPVYKSFRLHKRIKGLQAPPPTVRGLLRATWRVIAERPRLYLGLAAIHLALSLMLVRGLAPTLDIAGTQQLLSELEGTQTGGATTALSLLGQLVAGPGSAGNPGAGVYQSVIAVIMALAVIWAVRQKGTEVPIRIKDAFYRGMTPLVPFILILLLLGLQFVPAAIGGWVYSVVVAGGIAVTALEKLLWGVLAFLLLLLSLYMITSSVFALFIVTLPDMTPMRAIRSARNLVNHRRWAVASRLVYLGILMFMVLGAVMLPFLIWLPAIAEAVFVILSAFSLVIPIIYTYNLYYGLLK